MDRRNEPDPLTPNTPHLPPHRIPLESNAPSGIPSCRISSASCGATPGSSHVSVGQRLAELLPRAELHVILGGDHDLGFTHAEEVAGLIDRFLAAE